MLLNTEYVLPTELTGYARAALADFPVNRFALAQWLPNRQIDDLMYRFTRGGEGLTEAATYRAYDTESPIGKRPGVTRITGELPPISRKIRLGEYDRLRQRRADNAIRNAILDDTTRMVRAIAARLEMARGEALYTGKLTLNENGVIATVDFGRKAGHTVTAATLWTDLVNSKPITDLMSWRDTYVATNGQDPGAILTSRRIASLLLQNAQIKNVAYPSSSPASLVTQDTVNNVLSAFGLPPIHIYDAQVSVNGSGTRVIPDNRLLFLPTPTSDPAGTDLGATLLGTTAESMEPEYGLDNEADQPGIVAGAYSTKDPVAVWTKAACIGLPVLANPDLTFAATVA
jgi:hypothetical protein